MVTRTGVSTGGLEYFLQRERILVTPKVREIFDGIANLGEEGIREFCFDVWNVPQQGDYSDDDAEYLYSGKLLAGIYFQRTGEHRDQERAIFSYHDAAKWAAALSRNSDSRFLWNLRSAICHRRKAEICDSIEDRVSAFYGYASAAKEMSDVLRSVMSGNFDFAGYDWHRNRLFGFLRECIDKATDIKNDVDINDDRIYEDYRVAVVEFEKSISKYGSLSPGFTDCPDLSRIIRTAKNDHSVLFTPEVDSCVYGIDITQPFGISSFDIQTRALFEQNGDRSRENLRMTYARRLMAALVFGNHASAGAYLINVRDASFAYEKAAAASYRLIDLDPDEANYWGLRSVLLRSKSVEFSRRSGRFSDAMFSYICAINSCIKLIDNVDAGLIIPGWNRKKLLRILRNDFYDMQELVHNNNVGVLGGLYYRTVDKVRAKHNL